MTHLRILQNNGVTEEVSSSVVQKLYELASSGNLDNSSALEGRIHIGITYRTYKEYLEGLFNDFYIQADDYAIPFEDPNMAAHLNSVGIGSNGMVTENDAANAINISWPENNVVTKFNELRYFTNIYRTAAPSWGSSETNNASFVNWKGLQELDISNYISVGKVKNYC